MKFILAVLCLLLSLSDGRNSSPTLSVLCASGFIRVTVVLGGGSFFGRVSTRPYSDACNVEGLGEPELSLFVPLSPEARERCGVSQSSGYYSLVVDVAQHLVVESAGDATFLVQCSVLPANGSAQSSGKIASSLRILKDDVEVSRAFVGRSYTLELQLPNTYSYRVSSCVAFSGEEGSGLRFVPLMDERGCPLQELMSVWLGLYGTDRMRAELTMFRFNNSHDFHIQCLLSHCENSKCIPPSCRIGSQQEILGARVIAQNSEESMAAQRLTVLDHAQTHEVTRLVGCSYDSESGLIGLLVFLALLVCLSSILVALAFLNRPFRCRLQLREEPDKAESALQLLSAPSSPLPPSTGAFSLRRPPPASSIFTRSMPRRIKRADSVTSETGRVGILPFGYADHHGSSSTLRSRRQALPSEAATEDRAGPPPAVQPSSSTLPPPPLSSGSGGSLPLPTPPPSHSSSCASTLEGTAFPPPPPSMVSKGSSLGRTSLASLPAWRPSAAPSDDADRSVRSLILSVSGSIVGALSRLRLSPKRDEEF